MFTVRHYLYIYILYTVPYSMYRTLNNILHTSCIPFKEHRFAAVDWNAY